MKYRNVKNPQYIGPHKSQILVTVEFETIGKVDFVADQNDTMAHGRAIFEEVVRGKYGPIKPFDDAQSRAKKAELFRSVRRQILGDTDWLVTRHRDQRDVGVTTLSQSQYKELLEFRQYVRDFPTHPGFPSREIDTPDWIATACGHIPGRGLAANA